MLECKCCDAEVDTPRLPVLIYTNDLSVPRIQPYDLTPRAAPGQYPLRGPSIRAFQDIEHPVFSSHWGPFAYRTWSKVEVWHPKACSRGIICN